MTIVTVMTHILEGKCREPRELLVRKPNMDPENGREGFLEEAMAETC